MLRPGGLVISALIMAVCLWPVAWSIALNTTDIKAMNTPFPRLDHGSRPRDDGRADITIDGDFTEWGRGDLISLDPVLTDRYNLNDGMDNSRDIMATYAHKSGGAIYFRIDLYDLSYGAEEGGLDIYVTIDFKDGGQEWLPDFTDCRTDTPWEVAVALYDSIHWAVYYPDWTYHNSTLINVAYNSQWDAVEFAISTTALEDNGYSQGMALHYQFFTTKDGTNGGPGEIGGSDKADITDAVPNDYPWEDGWLNGTVGVGVGVKGEVKFAILHHGNQFIKNVTDFVRDANGLGFWKVPEIHEKWGVPVNLHVSGTLAEAIQWFRPDFNAYLRQLVDRGIVHMVGGFYSEYIPQYVPLEVNLWSMSYARWQIAHYYNDTDVEVAWVPERVFWDGYEDLIKQGGYSAVVVDTEDGFVWYAEPDGYSNEHKLYVEDNGLKVLFISNRGQGGAPYNIQDQMHNSYDGGLSITMREGFLNLAMDGDSEEYVLYMDDWEKTCGNIPLWGGEEVVAAYDNAIGWIANHPWIEVVPIGALLNMTPAGEVDINDCSYFWLRYKTGTLGHPNVGPYDSHNLYDAWYYDPLGEIEDTDYFNYTPADCNMKLGDYRTPGTIIGETWSLISKIPESSPVYELAMKTFSAMLYETAWFEQWGTQPLHMPYWEKEQAAHIRTAAIYYYVDQWLSKVDKGAGAMNMDVDLDGKDEYILYNDRIYSIFEGKGGKLAYAFDANGTEVIGNPPTGWLDEGDAVTDAITATTTNTHYSGEVLGMAESPGEEYLMGSKTYAFSDMTYENANYMASIDANSKALSFTYGTITKTFRLYGTRVVANYSVNSGVELGIRFTFSPDLCDILSNGTEHIRCVGSSDGKYFGWENRGVYGAVALTKDVKFIRKGTNAMSMYVEVRATSEEFTAVAYVSKVNTSALPPPQNTPPETILLEPLNGTTMNDTTPTFRWLGDDKDNDRLSYALYISTDPDISADDIVISDLNTTTYTLTSDSALESNTTYYWTVIPYDWAGAGVCLSGIWHFTLTKVAKGNTTIPGPVLTVTYPKVGSVVNGTITLRGTAYHPWHNRTIVGVEVDSGEGWHDASLTPSENGTYLWHYDLNTTHYENGPLTVRIRALDNTSVSALVVFNITINNTETSGGGVSGGGGRVDNTGGGEGGGGSAFPEGNVTGVGGGVDTRAKICYNISLCFILPMAIIVVTGIFIESMIQRRKKGTTK